MQIQCLMVPKGLWWGRSPSLTEYAEPRNGKVASPSGESQDFRVQDDWKASTSAPLSPGGEPRVKREAGDAFKVTRHPGADVAGTFNFRLFYFPGTSLSAVSQEW